MIKSLPGVSLGLGMILAASVTLHMTDRPRPRTEVGMAGWRAAEGPVRRAVPARLAADDRGGGARRPRLAGGVRLPRGRGDPAPRFNAGGDAAPANTIARERVGGGHDLIMTLSTPSLQAVAGANRDAEVPHVLGMVSDPVAAGVGIARDDPKEHPAYITGLGTMQPVAEAFRVARLLDPGLARVGVAWNPAEANSEACSRIARSTCKAAGIGLLEANAANSAAVREAVDSVIGRGAEAIWNGGDVTVLASLESVLGPARAAGVAVFSNIPGCASKGTLFDLGADYYRVGGRIGQLAGRVLGGESRAEMPILYEVPPESWLNRVALGELAGRWSVPPEVEARADVVVERDGPARCRPRAGPAAVPPRRAAAPARLWRVGLVCYSDSTVIEIPADWLRQADEVLPAGAPGRDGPVRSLGGPRLVLHVARARARLDHGAGRRRRDPHGGAGPGAVRPAPVRLGPARPSRRPLPRGGRPVPAAASRPLRDGRGRPPAPRGGPGRGGAAPPERLPRHRRGRREHVPARRVLVRPPGGRRTRGSPTSRWASA